MNNFSAPYGTPGGVRLVEGEVVLLGPDGVAVSMTVEAAEETGRRLLAVVAQARAGRAAAAEAIDEPGA